MAGSISFFPWGSSAAHGVQQVQRMERVGSDGVPEREAQKQEKKKTTTKKKKKKKKKQQRCVEVDGGAERTP